MDQKFLNSTLTAIDEINDQDPNKVKFNGEDIAKEKLYSLQMQRRQQQFCPDASEHLIIACKAQHIKRWAVPRSDYPMDKAGYYSWRTGLGEMHGDLTASLMADAGYSEDDQTRVKNLLQKKQLKSNPETQALEDIICLVFLEHYIDDFAAKHSEEKLIKIIQKTWNKMSEKGHKEALKLSYSEDTFSLIKKSLSL